MPNIFQPEFDEPRDREGFRARRARVGYQLGTERLGLSVWEIAPGQAAYPFHFHLGEEELLVVLTGRPSLRTQEGWRDLSEGDAISFLRGQSGAHQLVNRSSEPVRFLAVSTNGELDAVIYPDSNKLGVAERPPGGGGLRKYFKLGSEVDYYDSETHAPH